MNKTKLIKTLVFITIVFKFNLLNAQAFSFQATVRDGNKNILKNQEIGFKISILSDSNFRTLYSENHQLKSSRKGIATLMIGKGQQNYGNFNTVIKSNNRFYLKIESDLLGGTNYTLIDTVPITPLPYALQAENGAPLPEIGSDQVLAYCDNQLTWVKHGCPPNVDSLKCGTNFNFRTNQDNSLTIHYSNGNKGYLEPTEFESINFKNIELWTTGQFLKKEGGEIILNFYDNSGINKNKKNIQFNVLIGEKKCSISINTTVDSEKNGKIGNGVTDKFGNKYKTVIINENEWMAENLIVSKYTNDLMYPEHIDWYDSTSTICPNGWRIPSKSDWENLSSFLGPHAGSMLKENGTMNWYSPNYANNQSLFNALPKGTLIKYTDYKKINNAFVPKDTIEHVGKGTHCDWWASDWEYFDDWEMSQYMYEGIYYTTISNSATDFKIEYTGISQNGNPGYEQPSDKYYNYEQYAQIKLYGIYKTVRCIKKK